ncbi:putative transposase-associated domain-containing protein [Tanacetum coccineum]
MWFFPIIPRLQRLFKIKSISEDLRWHATQRITNGVFRHPADSQAWRTIDEKFPKITKDTRNLRLGISADRVDVNTRNRHHSVWPVLTVIYNLPPWLCMKRKFINLSVLISGYSGNAIDVFLEPLVDNLYTLFETGVDTYDASTKDNFNLCAIMLWTINDYPVLGTLCGCPYSGFKGYVVCGKDTNCVRLSASSKQSYALIIMTEEQIYNEVKHIENKWGKGKQTNNNASKNHEDTRGRGGKIQKPKRNITEEDGSSSQVNGENGVYWKKFNIWYQKLKYWRHNLVPHCIDFMHVEKNVAESIVRTLLHVPGKTKDGLNARLDLAELVVKPQLFAMQDEDKTALPPAGYTLTNAEKDIFCETLHNIKVPKGYCSNFSSLVNLKDRKLIGLKLHDYHMLMQEFVPIAIRSIMHPPTRYAIIRFCFFFKSICSKEIILQELYNMQAKLVVTLCLLEKFFPLSFFDIMIHLTVHLTREVKLCGPICFRWMYPFERSMKVIKGHVQNKNKLEGYIDEETITEETIEFFSEYHKSMETISIPPDKHESYEIKKGKPLSAGKSSEIVIQNTYETVPYIDRVSVEVIDLHISKEVATTRQAYYYGVLQEIRVLDYRFRQIPLFKCGWVNHKSGGVKRDKLGYTLVDLNNLGHKVDPFVLASQELQVFYVKDLVDKKLTIVFKTPPKNYKDTYDEVDEEFSTVIHHRNDNVLPLVDRRFNESDVKPSWKDIEKAKACMLAKAQASEASSKAKVEACGSKAKLQASTKTLIVKIPGRGSLEVDKIIDISSDSSDDRRWAAKKASALVFDGPSTQRLLDAYGCDTIEEYLEWNYFPSTDNESTNRETIDKGNTDKDCIDDSNSAMSKGKYVLVCKKHNPNMYSPVPVTGCVLGLASVTIWDEIEKKMGAKKSKTCADKAKGKRKVSCGS